MAGPSVTPIATVSGVRGERVACGPGDRWAAAERRLVTLDGADPVVAPRPLEGAMRFSASGDALLAGTERLELPGATWAALRDPRPAVADGAGELAVHAAAWDGEGALLAVAAERRPSWRAGAGAARGDGPHAWLTLLDGRARTAVRPLWHGLSQGPQNVAVEAGVVAADPRAHACVWTGEDERRLDAPPVAGLALGDGGRLLALAGFDGAVSVWHGPDFAAGTAAGDGAHGAIAVAASAPVVAWARAGGAMVWAAGATAVLPAPGIRALALDADGTRLVALDAASVLHVAAVAV